MTTDDDEPDGSGFLDAKADVERISAELATTIAHQQSSTGALVPVSGGALDAVGMKQGLAETRALVMRKREELKVATDRMRSELEAQMSAARAALAPVEKFVARLTEAIQTVNLYLGRDEEIVTLRDGEAAPEGTPIVCRSMVLSMAEETAIDPEHEGIDVRSIEKFDDWLLADPAHLQQVLPEPRGVVVLVPTKQIRDYGDPWSTRQMNEANRHSYWLIRNGDRLFRMDTDFNVGRRLVPARDEFTSLFYEESYDYSVSPATRTRKPMEPGSSSWARAEEQQGARERHYMKVALILQGLIDRTTVFHPLPAPGISLLKQESYEAGHVVLLDEEERALTTGRQPFDAWLREHNSELRPGMRIVGAFDSAEWRDERYSNDSYRAGHRRVFPATADYPESLVLHTIEERKPDGGLVFRYERGDKVYDEITGRYRKPKTRASATVYATDKFIIPIDLVSEDEMVDYLNARTERQHYVEMFPLLKAAIAVKKAEAEAELPFRRMLAGVLMTEHDLGEDEAVAAVDDLVRWWKFTNKHHRPLVGDGEHEAKAVRMIVAEFDSRRRAAATDDPAVVAKLKALPDVMLVARQRDGSYLALAPMARLLDPSEFARNVYAREWVVRPRGKTVERDWVLVSGTRAARWRILWSDERWAKWNRVATAAEHLSDPDAYDGARQAVDLATAAMSPKEPDGRRMGREARPGTVVRVTYAQRRKRFTVWVWPDRPLRERDGWGDKVDVPSIISYKGDVFWRRGPGGAIVVENEPYLSEQTWSSSWRDSDWTAPWENDRRGEAIVYRDDSKDDEMTAAKAHVRARSEAVRAHREHISRLAATVVDEWERRERVAAYERFLDDYADPDLWDGHKKTLRLGMSFETRQAIEVMVSTLVEAGRDVVGRKVADLLPEYDAVLAEETDKEQRIARRVSSHRRNLNDETLAGCVVQEPEDPDQENIEKD